MSDAPLTESSSNSDTFTINSFPFTLYVGASSSAETYTPLSDVSFHNYSSSGCDYNLDLASGLITVTSALNRSAIGIAATKEGWTFSSFLIWLSCPWSAATGLECDTFGAVTSVYGAAQLFCVSDLNSALPAGTTLSVKAVSEHGNLDVISDAEHTVSYNISLLDASGNPVPMPLAQPVRLWFEVLDWMDPEDIEIILAQDGEDTQFEEHLECIDGKYWVWIETDHFSPYTLVDKLSDEEKAALSNNVKTGDLVAELSVAGFCIVFVFALGIMISLIKNKKRISD